MVPAPARRRGRAFGPGLGRAVASAVALAATSAAALSACGSSHPSSLPDPLPGGQRSAIGAMPAWLPKASSTDGLLQATVQHPALATQGDPVDVHLGDSVISMRVTGPTTPPTGQVPLPTTVPCTWRVTMTATRGTARGLALSQWTVLSGVNGVTYHPSLIAGSSVPATLQQGQTASFGLTQVLQPGEGLVRFTTGKDLLSSWDFIAEVD